MEANELKDFPLLKSLQHKQWFEVPEGYFENLPQILHFQLNKAQEVEYPDLPSGYFDDLSARLMEKVAAEETPTLNVLPKIEAFEDVPNSYFETFSQKLQAKIEDLPIMEENPVLAQAPRNQQVYAEANQAYFDSFYANLEKKLPTSKKVSFVSWKTFSRYGMSLAAGIALLVTFFWINPFAGSKQAPNSEIDLSSLSQQEIVQALASEGIEEEVLASELENITVETLKLEDLSDSEVEELLNEVETEDFEL
ncbi:MAG: hypothetical protein ACKVTZ_13830 [Bacteroidia bacterium]